MAWVVLVFLSYGKYRRQGLYVQPPSAKASQNGNFRLLKCGAGVSILPRQLSICCGPLQQRPEGVRLPGKFEDILMQKICIESLSKYSSNFTIGFARVAEGDKGEDAESAGSGTLVVVGSLHGVLTAAHVVEALPQHGDVGIILNVESPAQYQRQVTNMDHTEPPVVIKADEFGPLGPDLAFLRIPDETLGWLKAKNSFYNLSKRRDAVLSGERPSKSYVDCITGIIHELTEEVPSGRPRVRWIDFYNIFGPVRPSAVRYLRTHDLLYVQLATEHEPTFKIPSSFEGTSGGAIWRFYVTEKEGKHDVIDRRLIAVPFHQSAAVDGKREITCHWSKSIYGSLIDEIQARWPNETRSEDQCS
jgi:hypothetical protein